MNLAIYSSELFGIVYMLIIIYGSLFESKHRSRKKWAFIALTTFVIISNLFDVISFLPIEWRSYPRIYFFVTLSTYIMPVLVSAVFIVYLHEHISEKASASKIMLKVGETYSALQIICTLILGFHNRIFVIKDGVYEVGDCFVIYMISYLVILLFVIVFTIANLKKIGLHDVVASILFVVIPIIFIIINVIYEKVAFALCSQSISIAIIYVMLQGETESKLIADNVATTYLANRDKLTGLSNRLAYTTVVEGAKGEDNLGVFFCDLNGLKYVNDNFGHKTGDELLCTFAGLLLDCFRKEDIFRISGDEFVILLKGMPESTFERKKNLLLEKVVVEGRPIAAVGYSYGREMELLELVETAELKMYEDKKIFHQKYPEYSRR